MNNKFITALFIVSASGFILYSCKNEFLEPVPQGVYSEAQLTNKQGLNGMLINAYATLDGPLNANGVDGLQSGGASNWEWGSITGGDAYKGTEPNDRVDDNPIMRYEVQPTNTIILIKWNGTWDGVGQANNVLKILPKVTDMTDAEKKQAEAEAKFIRGHHHFEGKKVFGNIPYIDETITDFKVPNTSGSGYVNVWPQIETDLKFAYDNLEETRPNKGRVNKWAAAAYLAKAYMFQNKYTEAKTLFDLIIANGKNAQGIKYGLTPAFNANFRVSSENNEETIFAIQYSYGDGANTNGNYDNSLNYPHSPSTPGAGCCGFFQPSQSLVNSYKTTAAGLPMPDTYNNADVTSDEPVSSAEAFTPFAGPLDPRLDWTVGRRGIPYLDWGVHPGRNWIRKFDYGGPYSPKKHVFYRSDLGTAAGSVGWGWNNNGLNYTIIRYADVLLMAAEAEIEVGSIETARQYINLVRARAALSTVKKDDGTNAANYIIGQYTTAFANKDEARKAVRFERKLELGMEGHRFFDLVRWGVAAETINGEYLSKETVRRPTTLNGVSFQKGKHEYQPIPIFAVTQSVKDGQPTLKQNPGY